MLTVTPKTAKIIKGDVIQQHIVILRLCVDFDVLMTTCRH